jgi:hypothetical protein
MHGLTYSEIDDGMDANHSRSNKSKLNIESGGFMKRIISVVCCFLVVLMLVSCADTNKYAKTDGLIVRKDILENNQYYFYVEYEIEGMDGKFDATIKVKNETDYNKYDIGDSYVFDRLLPK